MFKYLSAVYIFLLLHGGSSFGSSRSLASGEKASERVIYTDEQTGTQVLELSDFPSELFSWTSPNRLEGILAGRHQDGSFGDFQNRRSDFHQSFPQAFVRGHGVLFNKIHPLNFKKPGTSEFYGHALMKIHLKPGKTIRAVQLNSHFKQLHQQYEPLITGDFDFSHVDLVYNSALDEWIIVNPAIIAGITADPELLRPELEDWLSRLRKPEFKTPGRENYDFSFESSKGLATRVAVILHLANVYEKYAQQIREILRKYQFTPASQGSSSFSGSELAKRLSQASNSTERLATLIPEWSDLAVNPKETLASIRLHHSDLALAKIAFTLKGEPLAEQIWNDLAKKLSEDLGSQKNKELFQGILGIWDWRAGLDFAQRLIARHPEALAHQPELLAIFLEKHGYYIFGDRHELGPRLTELCELQGEPWLTLRAVVQEADTNRLEQKAVSDLFRARMGLNKSGPSCKGLFSRP